MKHQWKHKFRRWAWDNREKVFDALGRKCKTCGIIDNLEIHHVNYTYDFDDMKVLCKSCHGLEHRATFEGVKVEV